MANDGEEGSTVDYFDMLPVGCIADAVSYTSPVDACRLSLVASSFRSAAESDAVWERFLPSDYREVIARSVEDSCHRDSSRKIPLSFGSKKELYRYLCDNPLIIDGGAKSFSLDKWSGKKCYMIAAKDLSIVWGDTPRYWRWTTVPESRFAEVVELVNVCWFEIHGKINTCMLSQDTRYTAYLVFKPTTGVNGFEDQPVEASVGISGGESKTRTVYLDPEGGQQHRNYITPSRIGLFYHRMPNRPRPQATVPRETDSQYPKKRRDGWLEIEMGEYFNKKGEDRELEMTITEVKGGYWKSGLIVQGIDIRPKGGQ